MNPALPTTATAVLDDVAARLLELVAGARDDVARVDLLGGFEDLKNILEAGQAELAVGLDESMRAQQQAAGEPARRVGDGVAAQVALARRVSPAKGARLLSLGRTLVEELPCTLELMRAGWLSEYRASIIARETSCLNLEQRTFVDAEVSGTGKAAGLGDRALEAGVKKLAYQLDPEQALKRSAKAETDRRVTVRPAPDTMTNLTALLPVKDGVAVYAALKQAADTAQAAGDERTRGQVMADTLVQRITGHAAGAPAKVEIRLVMTDQTLFGDSDEPAYVPGYGPVPAGWARTAATSHGPSHGSSQNAPGRERYDTQSDQNAPHLDAKTQAWVKRLYTHPETGQLTAMDTRSRKIPAGLADFITTRDLGTCTTPYCDAPIRHLDHIKRWREGGQTTATNLRGLCERCNQARETIAWLATLRPDGSVATTTPSGHTYVSRRPSGWPGGWPGVRPRVELRGDFVFAA